MIRFNRAQRSENNGAIHMSVCQKLSKINGEHIIHLSLVDSGVRHTGEYHHRVEASFFVSHKTIVIVSACYACRKMLGLVLTT